MTAGVAAPDALPGCGPEPRSTTLAPAGGATSTSESGTGAVRDVGDGELEHRRAAALRVDRRPQRYAVRRRPRRARRSRAARRRASARPRRCRRAVRRRRSAARPRAPSARPRLGEERVDVGERRRLPVGLARGTRRARREIGPVDGVRGGVVDGDRLVVPDDLDVAASDWSSIRPWPSFVSQSRPEAPDISAEPA